LSHDGSHVRAPAASETLLNDAGPENEALDAPASPSTGTLALLWREACRPAMLALLAHVFVCNVGLYAVDFPIVAWMQESHGFTVAEVGWLVFVSAMGNLVFAVPAGIAFDRLGHKRALLATSALFVAGSALLLIPCRTKPALYAAQFVVAGAQGCVLTVQTSMVRIVADDRIGAATFGLVLGAMNGAAVVGTLLGGAVADRAGITTVFASGAAIAAAAVMFTPWIQPGAVANGGGGGGGDTPALPQSTRGFLMRRAFGIQKGMLGLATAANDLRTARLRTAATASVAARQRWHGRGDGYGSVLDGLAITVGRPLSRADEEGDIGLGFQGRMPLGVSDGASFSGDTPLVDGEEFASASPVADDLDAATPTPAVVAGRAQTPRISGQRQRIAHGPEVDGDASDDADLSSGVSGFRRS